MTNRRTWKIRGFRGIKNPRNFSFAYKLDFEVLEKILKIQFKRYIKGKQNIEAYKKQLGL